MIIKEQKPISFGSYLYFPTQGNLKVDTIWLEKALLWWQFCFHDDKPSYHLKTIFMHGRYPCVTLHGKKLHIHRLLMAYKTGRKLKRNEYVHHIDGDVFNSMETNLEIQSPSKHQSRINKGRKFSKEHRNRISDGNRRRAKKRIYENKDLLNGLS